MNRAPVTTGAGGANGKAEGGAAAAEGSSDAGGGERGSGKTAAHFRADQVLCVNGPGTMFRDAEWR
jgi:hypothetical protein